MASDNLASLLAAVGELPADAPGTLLIQRFVYMFEPVVRDVAVSDEEIESHTDVVNWICEAGADFMDGKDPPWGLFPRPDDDEG